MGGDGRDLILTIKQRNRIKAAVMSSQEHRLPLSNLDLLLPAVEVGVLFTYEKYDELNSWMIDILKKSLSETLATFYVLAGELKINFKGESELLCNNRGVDFIEAYANMALADLNLYNADECLKGKLVPDKDGGVLCIQATKLKCGQVVVACTFDHRIADAYSTNMFLLSWSELARSKPISLIPSFRRSIFSPRCPSHYAPSIPHFYIPASSLPLPHPTTNNHHLISRLYHITSNDIHQLQTLTKATTKLQAFSAYLWQTIAKGMKSNPQDTCKMGIVIDGRSRLSDHDTSGYFGNVLGVIYGKLTAEDLRSMDLSAIVSLVDGLIREGIRSEHFLGLIDWIEEQRPDGVRSSIYCEEEGVKGAIMVSSGRRFPVREVDFGWGRPKFGSYHFGWGGRVGHVMPMPSASQDGDWVVYARLMEWQVAAVEAEGGGMFQPMTPDYLKLAGDCANYNLL